MSEDKVVIGIIAVFIIFLILALFSKCDKNKDKNCGTITVVSTNNDQNDGMTYYPGGRPPGFPGVGNFGY